MREWLLKEEKAKVGRPKLANEEVIKQSKKMIVASLLICLVMLFSFYSYMVGSTPFKMLYSVSLEKVLGSLENPNGVMVDEYYKDDNYVMDFKVPDNVKKLGGYYSYTSYYLKNNEWIKYDSKDIMGKNAFKITFNSLKNTNRTWKIKFQILDGKKYDKSYEPSNWKFESATSPNDGYAYKIFTVKGYYSPVPTDEIKGFNDQSSIVIETKKKDPRKFYITLNNEYSYNINVSYTDDTNKNVILTKKENLYGLTEYKIPNLDKSTNVTFKMYVNNVNDENSLNKIKPSTWKVKKDKNNNYYIVGTYIVKPEKAY